MIATAAALILIVASFGMRRLFRATRVSMMAGAVVARNEDPRLQRPIGNARVTVTSGTASWEARSDASGLFRLRMDVPVSEEDILQLQVEHPNYLPATITTTARDQLYVLRLTPKRTAKVMSPAKSVTLSNIRVRYATLTTSAATVGTAVRTFAVVNKGNVPCEGRRPCSPDGKWKASIDSLSLDTGEQNKYFRNVRVSCIAGPCPFSAVEQDRFSRGGRNISVSVRNWSDTVTYLLEAEVATTMESELVRHTYPVTFGATMNFTVPAVASGLTIEADVDGSEIVYPLGPELRLSWATCRVDTVSEGARQYRCVLKPGYQFN